MDLEQEIVQEEQAAEERPEGSGETEPQETEDSATSEETGETESAAAVKEPKMVPISRFREVYGQAKRSEREADYWRQQALAAGQQPQQAASPQQNVSPTHGDEPKESDFEDYSQYVKALARHELRVAQEQAQRQVRAAEETRVAAEFQRRCEEARAVHDDWDDVVRDPSLPLTQSIVETARESEHATEILYFLGKNPDECLRIAKMSPRAQGLALGKIEMKVSGTVSAPPKKVSTNNLQPVKPVGQREGAVVDLDKMSIDEYIKYANKRDGVAYLPRR